MTNARKLVRRMVPGRTKRWLRKELYVEPRVPKTEREVRAVVDHIRKRVPIGTMPTFAGDSLVSWHNAEFLSDPAFIHAVDVGNEQRSWDSTYDVRWRYHVIRGPPGARPGSTATSSNAASIAAASRARSWTTSISAGWPRRSTSWTRSTVWSRRTSLQRNGRWASAVTPSPSTPSASMMSRTRSAPFPNVVLVRGSIPDTLSPGDDRRKSATCRST